jgi:hypothetical protein
MRGKIVSILILMLRQFCPSFKPNRLRILCNTMKQHSVCKASDFLLAAFLKKIKKEKIQERKFKFIRFKFFLISSFGISFGIFKKFSIIVHKFSFTIIHQFLKNFIYIANITNPFSSSESSLDELFDFFFFSSFKSNGFSFLKTRQRKFISLK